MNQSAIHWKQGFQLQAHHTEENNIRILLVGDSVIAGTEFIRNFHEHIEDVGSGKRCEIVKQITTEAMGWKFLLFLADEIPRDVDFIFVFLHAAETIAKPSEFRHVYALFSHLHAACAREGKVLPHVVIFRTPTGSSYGEFKPELCQLEERVHQELGASLVEIASPQTDMREDETHYTEEGILNLSRLAAEFCDKLQKVQVFHEGGDSNTSLSNAVKLKLLRQKTAKSSSSGDICRLHLEPSFLEVEYLFPHESIRVQEIGKEVLCLCFIGPYSGVLAVNTATDSHAITLSDSWCTVSRPYVVSLACSGASVEQNLEITLTDEIPKVKKYTLSERFDHEPLIDQSKRSFEFEISDYRYAGPTLFPFVAFCVIDY